MGMREEFEKWAAENGLLVDRWDHAPDSYIWFNTSLGWKAWQAAQHATMDDSARLDFLDQNLAIAAEREACAKLCDDMTTGDRVSFDWERGVSDCAHAIRARNQPTKGRD